MALEEDLGSGDRTTRALVPETRKTTADLLGRADGVLCGLPFLEALVRILDPDATVEHHVEDGARLAGRTIKLDTRMLGIGHHVPI